MFDLPKLTLHKAAASNLPPTGQRRDMLFKALRKIQVSPELGGDFQWSTSQTPQQTEVTVVVGYAISWVLSNGEIQVLDICGQ